MSFSRGFDVNDMESKKKEKKRKRNYHDKAYLNKGVNKLGLRNYFDSMVPIPQKSMGNMRTNPKLAHFCSGPGTLGGG